MKLNLRTIQKLQEETGVYDFQHRFHDPLNGRWTTVDPLAERSRRWSPYVYSFDKGIRFEDPDGMAACDLCNVLVIL